VSDAIRVETPAASLDVLTPAAVDVAPLVPVQDVDYDPIRAMVRCAEAPGFLILR
jgi:hypothetical protein